MHHQHLQQPLAQRRALRIHQPCIAVHQHQARFGVEALHVAAHPSRMPDIILVAQEQDVGLAALQRVGKVADITEVAWVPGDLDPDAQRLRAHLEGLQQRQRLVAGTIIADHHFAHRKILVEDAVQLRLQAWNVLAGNKAEDGSRASAGGRICTVSGCRDALRSAAAPVRHSSAATCPPPA
ncbi:hypothetical protein G6F65_020029 [Rhizopus arrhizus]|nr:hypothetical protein G6F65_020029 [Rhizopus arrhizus]